MINIHRESATVSEVVNKSLPWKERISYGISDFACNLSFQLVGTYLMFFYTDVFGIGAAAVGTLFLVARIVDAFDGPVWGTLIDHTHTRWGKSRPYFLWFMVPFALFTVLVFTTPNLSLTGKIVWAYITYIGIDVLYSAVNIPVYSILPSMTTDTNERVKLSTIRTFFGTVGATVITVSALPLVQLFGQGNQPKGFFYLSIVISIIFVLTYLVVFKNTRERVHTRKSNTSIPFKTSLKALKRNWPWAIVILINFVYWIGMQTKSQVTVYFFKYNMHNAGLASVVLGLQFISLIAVVITPFLTLKLGKRNTIFVGMVIATLGQFILGYGAHASNIPFIMLGTVIGYMGTGFVSGLTSVMLADAVDYGEWKNGVRAEGIVTSFSSLSAKLGMAVQSQVLF